MDEPTDVLTDHEIDQLFEIIRRLKKWKDNSSLSEPAGQNLRGAFLELDSASYLFGNGR